MDIQNLISELRGKVYEMVDQKVGLDQPKKASTTVEFDTKTGSPWKVSFSERGFLLGDTRLSFEILHDALRKGYSITLKDGTQLDAVKMQKILKYEDLY